MSIEFLLIIKYLRPTNCLNIISKSINYPLPDVSSGGGGSFCRGAGFDAVLNKGRNEHCSSGTTVHLSCFILLQKEGSWGEASTKYGANMHTPFMNYDSNNNNVERKTGRTKLLLRRKSLNTELRKESLTRWISLFSESWIRAI